jgi:Domain of unknown function (DUF4249)
MNKYILILLWSVLILSMTACEKVVTENLTTNTYEKRLVIEGGITRNLANSKQSQRIRLTETLPYLSSEKPKRVQDALVSVSDDNTVWNFKHIGDGWYENNMIVPKLNTTYSLKISWQGQSYEGEDKLLPVPSIDSLYYAYENATTITDEGYFVRLDFTDPIGVPNYYYYKVLVNDSIFIVPDRGNNRTVILSDKFFDGKKSKRINPNEEVRIKLGDTVTVQQLGIGQKYFEYLYQLFTQTGNQGLSVVGNPPPAPIRSNIINVTNPILYPLGYFYAADVSEKKVIIK